MSTQSPVRDERQPQAPTGRLEMPATDRYAASKPEQDLEARANRSRRSSFALAIMGAITLMSIGALLGAKLTGKRVDRRGPTRVTSGSPQIIVMFPFTAINFYRRRPRPGFVLARLSGRSQRRHAPAAGRSRHG